MSTHTIRMPYIPQILQSGRRQIYGEIEHDVRVNDATSRCKDVNPLPPPPDESGVA